MSEKDVIYDKDGEPRYRILDNNRIVNFEGESVAWLDDKGNIYDYDGNHKSWYEKGILRNHDGNVAGFGENPKDSQRPILPIKSIKPIPSITEIESIRPIPEIPPLKPLKGLGWSSKSLEEILEK